MRVNLLTLILIALLHQKSANSQTVCYKDSLKAIKLTKDLENLLTTGQLDSAYNALMELKAIVHKCHFEKSKLSVDLSSNLGVYWIYKYGNWDSGLYYLRTTYSSAELIFPENDSNLAIHSSNLGYILEQLNKGDSATFFIEKAITIWKQDSIHFANSIAKAYNNLGSMNLDRGANEKALKYFFRGLRFAENFLGTTHPDISPYLINISKAYENLKNYDDALKYLSRADKILSPVKGYENEKSTLWSNLALCYGAQNNHDQALNSYFKSLEYARSFSAGETYYAPMLHNIGDEYIKVKEYGKAEEYIRQALAIDSDSYGEFHSNTAYDYCSLGMIYYDNGKFTNALFYFKKALNSFKESLGGPYNRESVANYMNVSNSYRNLNDYHHAYLYLDSFKTANDSVWGIERIKYINELKAKYETEEKDNQIILQKKDLELKDAKLTQQKRTLALSGFIALIVLSSISGFFVLRNRQQELKYDKEMSELKLKALKAQISPHFIGSSLDSVRYYLNNNALAKADEYLVKFSALMRDVLVKSDKQETTLSEEIKNAAAYAELEQSKLNHSFDVQIHIEQEINADDTIFPALVLQPLVENCIHHGFTGIDYKGLIEISVKKNDGRLVCEVKDNGQGLSPGDALETKPHRKSFGLQLTEDRIRLYGRLKNKAVNFKVETLAQGVSVKFEVPYIPV